MILEKLRACWAFSPTVDRNVALVEGFLKGKSFADLAQEHSLSKLRVRQIIEKADRLVGGGILTKAEPSKASPRSDFMVDYPYVWNLAEMHRLGSVTPHHFFAELERAESLERLVDKMKRLPWRAPTTRELARLVWLRGEGREPMACNEAIERCDRGTKLPGRPSGSRPSMPARLGTRLPAIG